MWEGFCCMREEHKILQQVYAAKEDVQAADQLIVAYMPFIKAENGAGFCAACPWRGWTTS